MPRFHFHIKDNGRFIQDEEGQVFADKDAVRREALETVRQGNVPFLKVSISLNVQEDF
jgi:hypothetical protein